MKISRLEANKMARHVITRHYIDTALVSVSCSASEVHIKGWLRKSDGQEFTLYQMRNFVRDLTETLTGYYLLTDLENWVLSPESLLPLVEIPADD